MGAFMQQMFTNVTGSRNMSPANRHLPMLNEISNTFDGFFAQYSQIRKKKKLMSWFKRIPELTALVNMVAKDIVRKFHFENVNPQTNGRNKILTANKFALEVQLRKTMLSQMVDALVTGEGFGWMGFLNEKRFKELLNKSLMFTNKEYKETIRKNILLEFKFEDGFSNLNGVDEDAFKPRKYRSVASSTMEVVHDQFDISYYNHIVGVAQPVRFSKKEIIRFNLEEVDGKVNGFTPVESIIVQLELLRQMWQNLLSIHVNGGTPDHIITLKNTRPNSEAYKRIEQQLMKYKIVENRHGNMLFTGDIGVEELNSIDKMQFMDSGLYITGLLAMQWNVPRSSIPYIVGGTNTKDDTGGNSERKYWDNIEFMQHMFADTMNTQLWVPHFGVRIVFDNVFVQKDIQEETWMSMKLQNIERKNSLLRQSGKQLKSEAMMKAVGVMGEDVEMFEEPVQINQIENSKQLSDSDVNDSQDKKNKNEKKREEQESTIRSAGKPTGVAKERDVYKTKYWYND